jgi:AMP-polyphosphate phosphotransferase
LVERVEGLASKQEWQRGYDEINEFERMMVADGIGIVKSFCT